MLNGFENVVENGVVSHNEKLLHFPKCFQNKLLFFFLLDYLLIHHILSLLMNIQ